MFSAKRASAKLPAAPADDKPEDRPLSLYDNLMAGSSGSGSKVLQFPNIQFKFDDDGPSTLMSDAKSDFFGLSKAPAPAIVDDDDTAHAKDEPDESQQLFSEHDRRSPPVCIAPATSSPTSTASTAPARSSGSPHGSPGGKSRPISTHRNITIKLPDAEKPSEAVYMTTTVPQNFSKNSHTLIGRHKPTRSSLRHSRMLVVSKNFHQRYPKGNSLNLKHIRLSRWLMVLKVLIGSLLTIMGLAIMVWSPNTHTKDNPYWAGLILVLSGSLFLILFDYKRRPANRLRETCFNVIRVNALVILLLTIFFTMLAFIYALIHTANLSSSSLRCEPEYSFNVNASSCVCTIDTRPFWGGKPTSSTGGDVRAGEQQLFPGEEAEENSTTTATNVVVNFRKIGDQFEDESVTRLEYRDFNCSEVFGIWYYVTLVSTVLSSLGCLLAATFLAIYGVECQRRIQERKYLKAREAAPSGSNGIKMTEWKVDDESTNAAAATDDTGAECTETKPLQADSSRRKSSADVTESIDIKTSEA
ncbi:uncharacterized protein LOC129764936 [Toxorhynchites rutilus septentrionalis]|uniref:uncharacterized protein LOC129764936 n=1 Tax=Toxorhynchites rutilus septentrionalis TaxID=329112 RepID=UPI0024788030|nr:uncharacterized protein LOC129764936 [Toxorhynchites rutilus septentrionalis]